MSYDVLIKNGTVVDGTGSAPVRADVAISGGKIAAIGKVTEGAKRVIDASDLIVSPGFIDPHTHYDAQVCWDPLFTCSYLFLLLLSHRRYFGECWALYALVVPP